MGPRRVFKIFLIFLDVRHFSEAMKIAQGGKVMPAIPSGFLCKNCNRDIA